eukprot:9484730-Prorocentrum_lima.AAC.1
MLCTANCEVGAQQSLEDLEKSSLAAFSLSGQFLGERSAGQAACIVEANEEWGYYPSRLRLIWP